MKVNVRNPWYSTALDILADTRQSDIVTLFRWGDDLGLSVAIPDGRAYVRVADCEIDGDDVAQVQLSTLRIPSATRLGHTLDVTRDEVRVSATVAGRAWEATSCPRGWLTGGDAIVREARETNVISDLPPGVLYEYDALEALDAAGHADDVDPHSAATITIAPALRIEAITPWLHAQIDGPTPVKAQDAEIAASAMPAFLAAASRVVRALPRTTGKPLVGLHAVPGERGPRLVFQAFSGQSVEWRLVGMSAPPVSISDAGRDKLAGYFSNNVPLVLETAVLDAFVTAAHRRIENRGGIILSHTPSAARLTAAPRSGEIVLSHDLPKPPPNAPALLATFYPPFAATILKMLPYSRTVEVRVPRWPVVARHALFTEDAVIFAARGTSFNATVCLAAFTIDRPAPGSDMAAFADRCAKEVQWTH